ncbi:hypothetical protein Ddc_16575 [Ditylenchus destructor]|nr:hypothetical protein Ddc_16575 [Ditylenchus destructor]
MLISKKKQSNFTAFAKFHDNKWHSLLWFDYLRWSKSYIPGNCSYEEQILDGIVHPFAICMRRNVTEKFYKNIIQGDQTSSTLKITTDYGEYSSLAPLLLDQDDTEEGLLRIAEMRNITDETFQRFFKPYVIASSGHREITGMLIFSYFCFTNAVNGF